MEKYNISEGKELGFALKKLEEILDNNDFISIKEDIKSIIKN